MRRHRRWIAWAVIIFGLSADVYATLNASYSYAAYRYAVSRRARRTGRSPNRSDTPERPEPGRDDVRPWPYTVAGSPCLAGMGRGSSDYCAFRQMHAGRGSPTLDLRRSWARRIAGGGMTNHIRFRERLLNVRGLRDRDRNRYPGSPTA